jgi:predicted dehydrogenase
MADVIGEAEHRAVRLGVIGCGLVAQAVHFHYLQELTDRFDVCAICDISEGALTFSGDRFFPAATRLRDWRELLEEPLDAVMILTPGSHAPIALAAMDRGLDVFVEKPLAFSSHEAAEVVAAAEQAGSCVMVGYMKRYDPAYERLASAVSSLEDLRLIRVTTLESSIEPYVAHYPLHRPTDLSRERLEELRSEDHDRVRHAIGDAVDDPVWYWAYRVILLDCLVHEFNALRGLLGEPSELSFAAASSESGTLTASLRFGAAQCVLAWVDLPGLAHYDQEISLFSPTQRLGLSFPSPFLRNARTALLSEGGSPDGSNAWEKTEYAAHEDSFKRELIEFHECVTTRRAPRTDARDAARDISLCEAFVRVAIDGRPQVAPTVSLSVQG